LQLVVNICLFVGLVDVGRDATVWLIISCICFMRK
jgi:hypothetical protein